MKRKSTCVLEQSTKKRCTDSKFCRGLLFGDQHKKLCLHFGLARDKRENSKLSCKDGFAVFANDCQAQQVVEIIGGEVKKPDLKLVKEKHVRYFQQLGYIVDQRQYWNSSKYVLHSEENTNLLLLIRRDSSGFPCVALITSKAVKANEHARVNWNIVKTTTKASTKCSKSGIVFEGLHGSLVGTFDAPSLPISLMSLGLPHRLPNQPDFYEIEDVPSDHAAFPGKRLIFIIPVRSGTILGIYGGLVKEEEPIVEGEKIEYETGTYAVQLYDENREEVDGFYVDGGDNGNYLRFVNDYRNIKECPNARLCRAFDEHGTPVIVVKTLRSCEAGEECLIDYDESFSKKALQEHYQKHGRHDLIHTLDKKSVHGDYRQQDSDRNQHQEV